MSQFVPGQRWVVDSEPELGLGIVLSVDARAVTIAFPLAECQRMYTVTKAPLTRIVFEPNDTVQVENIGEVSVVAVSETDGLMAYELDTGDYVTEIQLANTVKMNQPFLRLMTGQLDKSQWFAFRRELDKAMATTWQSKLAGFFGTRATLIPHQLYVAWSASERDAVRVLLADEVGLGKTIEAGLILSRLIRNQRVSRVLVVVPEALQVQWLVELRRRFSIAAELYVSDEHDFSMGQVHLVPHEALVDPYFDLPEQTDFDLVIVDEAHHIQPGSPLFGSLEALSLQCPHLILLSATPEQLGVESHFARLKLLDPIRYTSIEDFKQLEAQYIELNQDIQALPKSRDKLIKQYDLAPNLDGDDLISRLLDCHGTGRVMYRNTRASVAGFPQRRLHQHILEGANSDAKFEWLADFARANKDEKLLVICHDIVTVRACEEYLWRKFGMDTALFHEEMTLLDRDRAAAYFAEHDSVCQILLCSEIGSEGRNFQFCHHLICMDLPDHPDVLEQRIGRLDRIGQTGDVNIHAVVMAHSSDHRKLNWFHTALQCMERQSPAASAVHDRFWADLQGMSPESEEYQSLVKNAAEELVALEASIKQGRDALLELNSCRQPEADALVQAIERREADTPLALVESASDLLNFHFEELGSGVYSLIPADNMMVPSLPGIPPEGVEVAFDRVVANTREDTYFLSWDAPFIVGIWELLSHSDIGSASVAVMPNAKMPAGRCLIEGCFELLVQSPIRMQCMPYLSTLSVRSVALDISDNDLSTALPESSFEAALRPVDKKLARKIIQSQKSQLNAWYQKIEGFAQAQLNDIVGQSVEAANAHFESEVARIKTLTALNPNVSDTELSECQARWTQVLDALKNRVSLRLSAIRLVVITEPER